MNINEYLLKPLYDKDIVHIYHSRRMYVVYVLLCTLRAPSLQVLDRERERVQVENSTPALYSIDPLRCYAENIIFIFLKNFSKNKIIFFLIF